ncbi:MAG: alcohol dehydrogenase catalytic domain-containing protein [Acidobacteria bacterium]|nr:alcohol dehydrogenase catalytic domain-containing protein [Acidobacteriota bacterium]
MKAALLTGPEEIRMGAIDQPVLSPEDVMIQPACVGICGTDISFYFGHRRVPYPFVLGHELMGTVAALGQAVDRFSVGQRVIVEPNYPCGSCRLCAAGRGAICPNKISMGVNVPGCFSEFAVAPAEFVWEISDSISDPDAATIEPLAVSMHGLKRSGAKSGDTVAVLGCGVVGLLLIHAASAMGIRTIAHDRIGSKLDMARNLGAAIASEAGEEPAALWERESVTTVFECAGTSATVELALAAAPRGANVVLLGLPAAPAQFIPMRLVREGINIYTSMIYDHPNDFARAIGLVADGTLQPSRVVTDTFPFESVSRALRLAGTGESGKIHVLMRENPRL